MSVKGPFDYPAVLLYGGDQQVCVSDKVIGAAECGPSNSF